MSTRNDAFRSEQVRTIFAPIPAAFLPHSESALRRLAISSKNSFVKYWTTDAALAAPKQADTKKPRVMALSRRATGKVLRTAGSAGPRVGSQAWSKARDSRSLPEGVPRFESWPTHYQFAPVHGRVTVD